MDNLANTRRFFDSFKTMTIWRRIFSWSTIQSLSFTAYEEILQLDGRLQTAMNRSESLHHSNDLLQQENNGLLGQVQEIRTRNDRAVERISHLEKDCRRLENENHELRRKLDELSAVEKQFAREYDARVHRLNSFQDHLRVREAAIDEQQRRQLEEKLLAQKETWKRHEECVKNQIRGICDAHAIEYVEETPFKGKPDNVIRICDEYIVFDAKSPASDELGNFSSYIRTQAESLKKYVSHPGVRKDIYLVVPTNTLDVLKKRSFDLGTYHVYVITLDALEPVILSMKKIEAYEFAEQLSPEERQSICRVIGGLIYTSKRRIQVDQYFNGQVLSLLAQTQREIPETIQDEIGKHEKAMKLNPEVDKRSKEINRDTLVKKQGEIDGHARIFQITTPSSIQLDLVANG